MVEIGPNTLDSSTQTWRAVPNVCREQPQAWDVVGLEFRVGACVFRLHPPSSIVGYCVHLACWMEQIS
jgi:hypothetical protein